MMDMPVAYEGKEPYIFISYAHKNSDRVLPLIAAIQRRGFRVWYDAGIEAGTEWPEYIAERVMGCGCFVAMLTKEALESHNCRREINLAISEKVPMLAVFMEDVVLSPGMKLQLGTLQAMFLNRHANEESFLDALCAAAILKSCRGAAETTETLSEADEEERQILRPLSFRLLQQLQERSAEELYNQSSEVFEVEESMACLLLAARKGFAPAQLELGYSFAAGRGALKNSAVAAKWFRLAAEQGSAEAQSELGVCYCEGNGVERDFTEAVKWFRLSAAQENGPAQCNLGLCYMRGAGVEYDLNQAKQWLKKALANGSTRARMYLDAME